MNTTATFVGLVLMAIAAAATVQATSMALLSDSSPAYTWVDHPDAASYYSNAEYPAATARPTNRWFMNAVLKDADQPIVAYPYSLRMASQGSPLHTAALGQNGVYVSLPVKETNAQQVIMAWKPDLLLTAPADKYEFEHHQLIDDDLLSVKVQWSSKDGATRMTFPVVRGSPYVTGIYSGGVTPSLYTGHAILGVNEETMPSTDASVAECTPSDRHTLKLNSGATVLVYHDRPACARWDRNRVVFSAAQQDGDWVIRAAIVNEMSSEDLASAINTLDTFRAAVPLSGSVSFAKEDDGSIMRMAWRTVDVLQNRLQMAAGGALRIQPREVKIEVATDATAAVARDPPCQLLMLALPHHAATLVKTDSIAPLTFDSIKGPMTAVAGNVWRMRLKHLSGGEAAGEALPNWYSTTKPLATAKGEWIDAVRSALVQDAREEISEYATDPYGFGKVTARMARLALIADELEETAIAKQLRAKLIDAMEPWLSGANENALLYDRIWGGLVPTNGLKDRNADFGAGWYNDHHFHYGYFIYSLAVIVKEERAWGEKWKQPILTFVRDIANPDLLVEGSARVSDNLDAASDGGAEPAYSGERDSFFPSLRHMDVFDGHSWANGVDASPDGRNQESSTEAVNAYYAISLLGRAFEDQQLQYLGEVLTSLEIQGARHYWHMSSTHSAYSEPFSAGKCVGMVWSDKVVQQTWFATGLPYVHGINILPITPVTELVLTKDWVQEEYPVLEKSIPDASPKLEEAWLGFIHADLAVLDPETAWSRVLQLNHFDGGASLTNFLYWIATRPTQ